MVNPPNTSIYRNVDAPDPTGADQRGVDTGYDFAGGALGRPELIFSARDGRDVFLQADVFEDHVHVHCPMCRLEGHEHGLMIRKGVKAWLYEPMHAAPAFPGWEPARMLLAYPQGMGGRLSIEAFECPWCKHKLRIDHNVVALA
jgi:hypothetical protein